MQLMIAPILRIVPLAVMVLSAISSHAEATFAKNPYHAWNQAVTLSNGTIEVVVVPEVGRIMQMRFAGEADGPFWENRKLDGTDPDSHSSEWINFGGDKTWPAPQSEWERITGRGWPPPAGFDSQAIEAQMEEGVLVLLSKADPHYGIEIERRIRLADQAAEMTVRTTYRKKFGTAVPVSIWVITQLKDPVAVFMPLPAASIFEGGYCRQSSKLPEGLKIEDSVLSCTRSTSASTKIGSDASQLIWAGEKELLEIISAREDEGEFPDQGSSAEIYTNPDPLTYVELELLGPLRKLAIGESMSRTQTYRLHRRAGELKAQIERLRGSRRP